MLRRFIRKTVTLITGIHLAGAFLLLGAFGVMAVVIPLVDGLCLIFFER